MYKLGGRRKIGRTASHRRSMINNQVRSLLISGEVVTTTQKAKILKANASSYLSDLNKLDEKHVKVRVYQLVNDDKIAQKVTKYVFESPAVGIVKTGYREGDNAQQSKVTLIGYKKQEEKKSTSKKVAKAPKKDETEESSVSKGASTQHNDTDRSKNVAKGLGKIVGKERSRARSGL